MTKTKKPADLSEVKKRILNTLNGLDECHGVDSVLTVEFKTSSGEAVVKVQVYEDTAVHYRYVAIAVTSSALPVRGWEEHAFAYARAYELMKDLRRYGYTDG